MGLCAVETGAPVSLCLFVYAHRQTSELTDEMPEAERDGGYFRAVLEHIAQLVLRKTPRPNSGKRVIKKGN